MEREARPPARACRGRPAKALKRLSRGLSRGGVAMRSQRHVAAKWSGEL